MDYISVKETADKWGITRRRVQVMCAGGKINGAVQISGVWVIPSDAERPPDGRRKAGQQAINSNKVEGDYGKQE